jgi:predicted PurR-regulated permease PerM
MQAKKIFTSNGILLNFTLLVTGIFFLFYGLIEAKEFLAPLVLAMVLALLTFPLANKLESLGVNSVIATLLNVLLLLLLSILFALVISWQMKNIVDDWEEIKESLLPQIEKVEAYLLQHTPLEQKDLDESKSNMGMGREDDENESDEEPDSDEEENSSNAEHVVTILGSVTGFLIDFLITFVYIFFFIHFRRKFKEFLLRLFDPSNREETKTIISKSASVVRHYLIARLLLMVFLVILYALGLWISGVENYIVVSIIAALFSIIPFVGNFFGYILAMAMGVFSGGDMSVLIGVTITFILIQFLDTYVLQPIILGDKLNVHPFFIILSVILGNAIWGIIGMALAIPVFAIISVITRNVPVFETFGFLFSSDEEKK